MQKNIRRRKSPTYLQKIIESALIAHDERKELEGLRINRAVLYPSELPALRLRHIPGISDPADVEEFNRQEAER